MGIWDSIKRATSGLAPAVLGEEDVRRVTSLSTRVANCSDAEILAESRRIGPLVANILRAGETIARPGVTTAAIADAMLVRCREEGLEPAMLGFHGFPAAAAVSLNDEIVHGIPSARKVAHGDLLKLEMGVVSGSAFAAQSWSFPIGDVAEEDAVLLATGRDALRNALATISSGSRLGDIGGAIQSTAEAEDFAVVSAYLGHGMGKRRFQDPQIPGRGRRGTGLRLRAGMILNVQVILKQGADSVEVGPNRWTASADDGGRGVIFTGMVEVTADGHVELTREAEG